MWGALAVIVATTTACNVRATFTCTTNDQCRVDITGTCEPTGYCSFPDDGCASGRKYDESAGGLANACVDVDIVPPKVTGTGSLASPFTALPAPASCAAFLALYPMQAMHDGSYAIDPGSPRVVYCDMSTDAGGWTLVARVTSASSTHVTAAAIGTLTDPMQLTTAKLADSIMTTLAFTTARLSIDTLGKIYVQTALLDLSGADVGLANAVSPTLAGSYIYDFSTSTGCNADCGVGVVPENMGFGKYCGYRYYASQGNPRDGMGCAGAFGKDGTVWVK